MYNDDNVPSPSQQYLLLGIFVGVLAAALFIWSMSTGSSRANSDYNGGPGAPFGQPYYP